MSRHLTSEFGRCGRALHLVDAENLAGCRPGTPVAPGIGARYRNVVRPGPHDIVRVATDASRAFDLAGEFPGCGQLVGRGPDGAELALLRSIEWSILAERYTTLVIASGDHAFALAARGARACGLVVVVVSLRQALSRTLSGQADAVLYFPDTTPVSPTLPLEAA